MENNVVSAVIFDWNYTLAKFTGESSLSERIAVLLFRLGLVYSIDDIRHVLNVRQMGVKSGKMTGKIKPKTRREFVFFYKQILELLGVEGSVNEISVSLYEEYGYLPVTMYEDGLHILQLLSKRGISLGIVSNISASARRVIETNVKDYIEPQHIIISGEIGIHKPAKTIFSFASSQLRVSPSKCIYIGDDLESDAIGSVQNGQYKIGLWLDRRVIGTEKSLPSNVYQITSLNQVENFI